MLGKLIKHEWKAIWKLPTLVLAILLLATILCSFIFYLPFWKSSMEGLEFLSTMVFLIYYVVLISSSLAITFTLFSRFYKSMFTDEGYLTHTLPVTPRQLLLSKGIVIVIWYLLSTIGLITSILIFVANVVNILQPLGNSFPTLMANAIAELSSETKSDIRAFIISLIVFFVFSLFSNLGVIIGSVCFGQLVNRHKIMGTISAYLVIYFIIQVLMTITMFPLIIKMPPSNYDDSHVLSLLTPFYYHASVISVIIGTSLFFLSERIIKRKINLD